MTTQNYGPIAATSVTVDQSVTLSATSGGPPSGQTLAVASNSANLPTQLITPTGRASALAQGSLTPSPTVDLGNFRIGGAAPTRSFAASNLTTGPWAERLGIGGVATTGAFAAVTVLGGGLVAQGRTQPNAATATISGRAAGLNTGTLTVDFTTNGQLVNPGLMTQSANTQTVTLTETGFNPARGTVSPSIVELPNQRVGGTATPALEVRNIAPVGPFSEVLNASFAGTTGAATTNGAAIGGLVAGAANGSALGVDIDTSAARSRSGTVTIAYETDGRGTSGLPSAPTGTQSVAVSGDVDAPAQGRLDGTSLNFGWLQVGQAVSQALSITKVASGPAGSVEDLYVSSGSSFDTGASQIVGIGDIVGLRARSTGASGMVVSVNTAASGTMSGRINVNYLSVATPNDVS